ncbi:MAG: SpoIIE family protein phosphatase, partial [Chloroflexales bacterium]|nr:SpoIIE family protein phosphatase [Chloroflexales bacterium]
RLHSRFAAATALIDGALTAMRAAGDEEGELWALAEWLVTQYHAEEYAPGVAAATLAISRPMSPYLRSELYFGQMICLIGLEQSAEAIKVGEAGLAELDREPDPWLRRLGLIQMLRNIAAAYHYGGATRRAVAAAERAAALAQEDTELAHTLPWCFYELGLAYWRQGRLATANETLDTARRLAEEWRHSELWRWAVAAQGHVLRDQGHLDSALAAYQLAGTWGEDPEGPAFIQMRQGRLAEARWSCEARLALARHESTTTGVADARLLLALVELATGSPEAGLALLDQVSATYSTTSSHYYYATAQLYSAAAWLLLGRRDLAETGLRVFLDFARREEVLTCAWWVPELVELLLLHALRVGIEPDWARRILERRFLGGETGRPPANDSAGELALARRVQLSLLPDAPPMMPDLQIAAVVLPAAEIGGDFVGYAPRGGDPASGMQRQLGLAVGDISGKGLGAALLLSGVVVAMNSVAATHSAPAAVAAALNEAVRPYTTRSHMNIGLLYAQLTQDQHGWALRAVGAGGVPPLIRRAAGQATWLETAGFPIGTAASPSYSEAQAHLAPGDTLVLMSDGVIESMTPGRELFGFENLTAAVVAAPTEQGAHAVLDSILTALSQHAGPAEQHDDITLIVVRVLAGAVV